MQFCTIEYSSGIKALHSSPYLSDLIFFGNNADYLYFGSNGISIEYPDKPIYIGRNKMSRTVGISVNDYLSQEVFINDNEITGRGGIGVGDSDLAAIDNNVIANSPDGRISASYGGLTITNNKIVKSAGMALSVSGQLETVVHDNSIVLNDSRGGPPIGCINIAKASYAPLVLTGNNVFLNIDYDISNATSNDFDAPNNWWGTTDASSINNKIYDYYDDMSRGKVNYTPIATQAFSVPNPLVAYPIILGFTPSGTPQEITLQNTGPDNIDFHIETSDSWLHVNETSGSISSFDSKNIMVSLQSIPAGYNSGYITVLQNDGTILRKIYVFTDIKQHSLSIARTGTGDGNITSSPVGINCGDDCTVLYAHGTSVTLTAIADTSSTFEGWSGCNLTSGNTCTVTMNDDKTITANFSQIAVVNYTLNLLKSGNGSVKVDGTIYTLPWSGQFPSGTNVQIEAISDSGWGFTNWTGDYTGSTNPTSINMSGNKNITANFSQNCDRSLTIIINPPSTGTVTKNPDKANYCNNEQVSLTANPSTGYNFSSWGGVDSSSGTAASITMNDNRNITANFIQQPSNGPDLTGYWISLVQSCSGIKCKIKGKCNIQNIGNESASTSVRFYLSDDSIYDAGDSFLKELKTGTLKMGISKSKSLSYSFVPGISATDKYIIAVIDADNTVVESNESNNAIVYGPIPRANLTGTWISLTQQCKGTKCKINGTLNIQNTGGQDAISSFVRFYLSDDAAYDEGDMYLKQVSIGTLKVSKIKKMNLSYSFPSGVSAYGKYIIAVIDADNSVLEANEGDNNIAYGPIP